MDALLTTIVKRPYVFLFLAGFLYLSIRHQGLGRTAVWLFTGYIVAFFSELSSIHNGFPYGEYHYIYENLRGELLLAGVPVWDSLSYAFMTYAGYGAAVFAAPKARLWRLWLAGSFLTMMLDVVTDPVARMGKEWFLGEIFYYAHGGFYFGVPWTNFAGWFLVSAIIIGANLFVFAGADSRIRQNGRPSWLHPVFYLSICLFNVVIAFWIGAYPLGLANLFMTALIAALIFRQ